MRLRVRLDVRQPLKREKRVRRNQSEAVVCEFRYERLPNFCYICGKLGHIDRHCEVLYRVPTDKIVRLWDEKLRAVPRRSRVSSGDKWLVRKETGMETIQRGGRGSVGRWRAGNGRGSSDVRIAAGVRGLIGNFGASRLTANLPITHDTDIERTEKEPLKLHDDRKHRRNGEVGEGSGGMEGMETAGSKPTKSPKKNGHGSKNVVQAGRTDSACPTL
ncbi:hypothetical protein LINPERHAP1_LOCUS3128 [Linum perenne]